MPLLSDLDYDERKHNRMVNRLKRLKRAEKTITAIIERMAEGYNDLYGVDSEEINSGLCDDFAADVCAVVKGATHKWDDELRDDGWEDGSHNIIIFEGRFYDAECSEGVDNWRELPYFERVASRQNA